MQDVVFRATALVVPLTAAPVVVRLPPSLLTTATDFVLAEVQVRLIRSQHHTGSRSDGNRQQRPQASVACAHCCLKI